MTTIGVLRIARTKSSAVASARSPVFFAMITSTSIIFSTGEKKWMPMKSCGRGEAAASEVIGSVEVLEPKIASATHRRERARDHVLLDGAVLEHRLDDEVGVGERREVGAGRDPRERGVAGRPRLIRPRETSLSSEAAIVALPFSALACVAVEERDGDAGPRADCGDAGAHEARADDRRSLRIVSVGDLGRAAGELVQLLDAR